jgi:hypothetical protein
MSFWLECWIKKCQAQSHSILTCGPSHMLHKWKLTLPMAYPCNIFRVHKTLGDHLKYTYCWGYIRLSIHWKLTSSGEYSCSSAYSAQFAGAILSSLDSLVCKNWAPPKCNLFAWLIIQNRVWTSDHLQKRGWPNGIICPLCRCVNETKSHLLFKCLYAVVHTHSEYD